MTLLNLLNKSVVLEKGERSIFFRSCFATHSEGYNPGLVLKVCLGKLKYHMGEKFRFATKEEVAFIKSGDTKGVLEEVIYFEIHNKNERGCENCNI